MTKTDEGYLICHNVPINRIGVQEYMGDELGMNDSKAYKVLREPGEVFNPAALASFEGKPITDGHPPEAVNTDNIQFYEKGHASNIRKGTGSNTGTTVADLFITDPQLIHEIEDGKREISCGYNYVLLPHKNGTFEQRSIRGNHIAVVDEGRAGPRVAIKDEKPKSTERGKTMATENKGSVFGRMLKAFAKDESTTPDDLEEAVKTKKPDAEDELPTREEAKPEQQEKKPEATDESPAVEELLKKIMERLDKIEAAAAPKESEDELEDLIHPEHEAAETPEEEAEERTTGREDEDESPEEQEPSVTIPAEEITEKAKGATDEARRVAVITQNVLKQTIKDPKALKMAAKDAAARIRKEYGIQKDNSGYSTFVKTTSTAAKTRAARDSANQHQKMLADVQSAYDSMNPHNKGVK